MQREFDLTTDEQADLEFDAFLAKERAEAIAWARGVLAMPGALIVDTETTALDETAEAIEIGVLAIDGTLEYRQRFKPLGAITEKATERHGITEAMLANAPAYVHSHDFCRSVFRGNVVVMYNAAYDQRVLIQTANRYGCLSPLAHCARVDCAMLEYARFVGEWKAWSKSFTWQKLPPIPGETAHNALSDAKATLALIRMMAEAQP